MAKKRLETELKVGLFVTGGLGLMVIAILVLGSADTFLKRKNHYSTHMISADGLIVGAKVMLSGIHVGTIGGLNFNGASRDVVVNFDVDQKSSEWVRQDSYIEIQTQGVLGDKFLSLVPGTSDSPQLPDGAELTTRSGKDLSHFLNNSDKLLASLNSVAGDLSHIVKTFDTNNRSELFFSGITTASKNLAEATGKLNRQLDDIPLKSAIKNLNAILEKVNTGSGTLSSLINDPGLYDSAKALVGGANRNRIVRNLVRQAIRRDEEGIEAANPTPNPSPKKK